MSQVRLQLLAAEAIKSTPLILRPCSSFGNDFGFAPEPQNLNP